MKTKILQKEIEEKVLKEVLETTKKECNNSEIPLTYAEECVLIEGVKQAISLTQQKAQEIFEKKIEDVLKFINERINMVRVSGNVNISFNNALDMCIDECKEIKQEINKILRDKK